MTERTQNIYAFLREEGADAALILGPENRRYYTGFTGSTGYGVLMGGKAPVFLCDSRYSVQACGQCAGYQVVPCPSEGEMLAYLARHKVRRLAVEAGALPWRLARLLLDTAGVCELLDLDGVARQDRLCKTEDEVALIKKACGYTDQAFTHILTLLHPGMTEAEINFELQTFLRRFEDVERAMDRYIVASGPRGAMPHGVASGRVVQPGELITLDYGCCVGGYWSDMTRTVCLGRAGGRQRELYQVVEKAQQAGRRAAAAGKTGREVDAAARGLIQEAGYGKHFGHGLGHGLGLSVREAPILAQSAEGEMALRAGMVATIEPGVYIEGFGGVRIEDDVLITETGCEVLTQSPRELIEL